MMQNQCGFPVDWMRQLQGSIRPLTLPGMLSTAGHWDQSRDAVVMFLPSFPSQPDTPGASLLKLGLAGVNRKGLSGSVSIG
jgi:hypothetical protein